MPDAHFADGVAVIGPDDDRPSSGEPGNPLHAMLAAALMVAVALLVVSIVRHEVTLDVQRHALRDLAVHRYAPNVAVPQPVDDARETNNCPEPDAQLLC